jgi:hypothetical protein
MKTVGATNSSWEIKSNFEVELVQLIIKLFE